MRVVAAVMLACRAPWRSSGVGPRGAICLARDACVQRDPRVGTRHAVRDVSALLKTLSVRSASTMTGAAWLHAAESRAATASRIVGRHARIDTVFRRAPHIRTQVRVSRAHVNRDERLRICLWGEWKDGTRPVVEALAGETGCCCTVLDGVPRACAERCHGRQHHHRPVGPIERAAAQLGQQLSLGARLYFNAVNAAGGIHGRKIDFKVLDDGFDADTSARNTRTLINDAKAFALFGYVGTQSSMAALKVANPAGVPFFAPYAGAQSLREPFARNVFHVRAGFNDETAAIIQQIRAVGQKRIAVIYNDDAYGRAGLDGLRHALALPANAGLALVGQASVARYTTDIKAVLSSVLAQKPEVIAVVCGYQTVVALVSEAQVQGYAGQFYNLSLVGSKMQTKELGTTGSGVVISQVMPYPRSVSTPIVREYQKLLKANGITDFDYCSLEGYIAARALVDGLRGRAAISRATSSSGPSKPWATTTWAVSCSTSRQAITSARALSK